MCTPTSEVATPVADDALAKVRGCGDEALAGEAALHTARAALSGLLPPGLAALRVRDAPPSRADAERGDPKVSAFTHAG